MSTLTDILQQSIDGDEQSQRTLYEQYRTKWYMLSMRYGKNKEQSDDIFQEGLIQVFKDLHQYDPHRGAFSTWSSRLFVNAALKYLKKHTWATSMNDQEELSEYEDQNESILDRLASKEVSQLVQQLPVGYRVVFNMYAIEGYKHHEIAAHLGITVGTSKSQLSKARKELRNQLESLFKITHYE